MAWVPRSWTTRTTAAFRRCAGVGAAPAISPATQHLWPSRPSAWPSATSTSTSRASTALASAWRRTTTPPPAVVAAAVEVVVVDTARECDVDDDCDAGSPPVVHVYGSVTAKTRSASGDRWVEEHSLFHRAKGQLARVPRVDAAIPLQSTAALVSAPLGSELQVSAELLDASASWQNPDQELARGSVLFAPRLAGTDTAEIAGADGKVRVDVTWSTQ
ncbi:hypothetical protein D1007_59973 [Hordeum vulgare]|nr:hypothetical protein D1007_59973 [Hordeum vulgare]